MACLGLTSYSRQARLVSVDGSPPQQPGFLEGAAAEAVAQRVRDARWSVLERSSREQQRQPPAPFTTSTLQQEANNRLGMGRPPHRRRGSQGSQLHAGPTHWSLPLLQCWLGGRASWPCLMQWRCVPPTVLQVPAGRCSWHSSYTKPVSCCPSAGLCVWGVGWELGGGGGGGVWGGKGGLAEVAGREQAHGHARCSGRNRARRGVAGATHLAAHPQVTSPTCAPMASAWRPPPSTRCAARPRCVRRADALPWPPDPAAPAVRARRWQHLQVMR